MRLTIDVSDYASLAVTGFAGVKVGHAFVNLIDVPSQLAQLRDYTEVNVREPKVDSDGKPIGPVAKAIIETLQSDPAFMALKSRGLLVLANKVSYTRGGHGENGKLEIEFTDKRIHGLVDGGHTYATITSHVGHAEDKSPLAKGWLPIRILTGVPRRDTPEIADGQNTSRQVDPASLLDNKGQFDVLKRALGPSTKHISWHYGDEGLMPVDDLLKVFMVFDLSRFDDNSHPTALYRGKTKTTEFYLDLFKESKNKMGEAMAEQLPVMLAIYEGIQAQIPLAYNSHNGRVFGKLSTVTKIDKQILPMTGQHIEYLIPTGLLLPILSGFRALLEFKGGKCTWRKNPIPLIPDVLKRVVLSVFLDSDKTSSSEPGTVGKDSVFYNLCYMTVQRVAGV